MLKTEMRNKATMHIDKMSTVDMLLCMHKENENAVNAVGESIEQITNVVDAIFPKMQAGGRLFYIGCGTSGRLGVLDAAECPPTFGVSSDRVVGIIAGGDKCLRSASENAEDMGEAGVADLSAYKLTSTDCVIGLSVAGGASYVIEALKYAKSKGCLTVGFSCNKETKITQVADLQITPDTGAEALTGSTRMKAGTAQKLILNMISTALMIKMGYVYENLMINLKPSNAKLRDRCIRITTDILACGKVQAEEYLITANWDIRKAISIAKGI